MNEHATTSSQSGDGNSSSEIVARTTTRKRLTEKYCHKKKRQARTDDTAVGQYLQIVVVSLLQSIEPIARIIECVIDAKSTQACTHNRMILDHLECYGPEVSSSRRWIVDIHAIDHSCQ